jgi:hypothetical protein
MELYVNSIGITGTSFYYGALVNQLFHTTKQLQLILQQQPMQVDVQVYKVSGVAAPKQPPTVR